MRIQNFLIVVCALVVCYWGIALMQDIVYIDTAVSNVHRTVATAAEQALTQVVASDELFNNGVGGDVYDATGVTTVFIANSTDNTYTKRNLFETVYKTDDKDTLYKYMYGPDSLMNNPTFMTEVSKVKSAVGDYNIPIIARMGLLDPSYNLIPQTRTILQKELDDSGYSTSLQHYNSDWLGTRSVKKSYTDTYRTYTYYLAPTNVGITYIDANLLQTAFISNMDLLMRAKFQDSGGLAQGAGVPDIMWQGEDYVITADAEQTCIDQNIINNGLFAYVKGELKPYAVGTGYTGGITLAGTSVKPIITYKVIDVCDEANAQLVRLAISDVAGVRNSQTYQEWLTTLGINPNEPHYCVIAKVTFYADIIIPFGSDFARNLYSLYVRNIDNTRDTANDFYQATITDTNIQTDANVSAVTGNLLYTYTTYYAVMP